MTASTTRTYESWSFMIGTGRCGSSVFHEVLARHPDVGFISNIDDRFGRAPGLGAYNNRLFRGVPQALTVKGRPRFAPSEGYRILAREVSPALCRPVRDLTADDLTPWLAERLRRAFHARADAQRTRAFSHKLTGWPRTGLLAAAFPGARTVHVVRDGRAVANSFLQMPWWGGYEGAGSWRYGPLPEEYAELWHRSGRSFPVLAALTWRMLMDAYETAETAAVGDSWLTVRYEDALADPRKQFDRILDHVGLEWSEQFETGMRRQGLRRPTGEERYRRELAPRDVAAMERVIGPTLERYGYV